MRARRRLLGLLSVALAPVVFLLALEGLLRVVGYGHDAAFFVRTADGEAWTTNPEFGYRFFAPGYQIRPEPARIPREKGDELRIVVLGGSAAFGDLDFGYGFGRFLGAMLQLQHPERRIRVVSAALSGANSHVMRLVARDARVLQPDLFVILLGNNEVVGPFGAGAFVADPRAEPRAPALWSLRTGLALGETRVGQLLGALLRAPLAMRRLERPIAGQSPPLPAVAADDPRLARTYADYAANLAAIVERAPRSVLCTVPVNLRDSEPSESLHGEAFGGADAARWEALVHEADFLLEQRQHRQALERYREAAQIDPGFAAVHYRLGRALEALGEAEAAEAAWMRARDLDALRSRADSEINRIVRRSAESRSGVLLVDLERDLARRAPGRRLFYDHVHFTLRGNYEVARSVLPAVERALNLDARGPPGFADVVAALPVTAWDRLLLSRRRATRGLLPGQRRGAPAPVPPRDELLRAERQYRARLESRPDDLIVGELLTELQLGLNRGEAALAGADRLLAALPDVPRWRRLRGAALLQLERPEEALDAFGAALDLDPFDFDARVARAQLRWRLGRRAGAIADLDEARQIQPGNEELRRRLETWRRAAASG